MTTSRDVARAAAVSQATVWAVLSGKKFVSEELRARVLAIVEELNYQPNDLAKSLKARCSNTVGVIMPTLTAPTWNQVLSAVEETLARNDLSMVLAHSGEDCALERTAIDVLRRRRVDGLLVAPAGPEIRHYLIGLAKSGMPIVLNTRYMPGIEADTVIANEREGARAAVSHLLALGRRRVALVGMPEWSPNGEARIAGYRDGLSAFGLGMDMDLQRTGRSLEENGLEFTEQLLALPNPPDAIFADTHALTIGVLRCLRRRGLRVPDDIALVSFDDLPWCELIDPPLTTVRMPQREMGAAAAELLVQRMAGEYSGGPRLLTMETQLVVRRSCGAPSSHRVEASVFQVQGAVNG